jgi:cyclopropane fatty-acyl-phospholipid synthase-like methyltransferase
VSAVYQWVKGIIPSSIQRTRFWKTAFYLVCPHDTFYHDNYYKDVESDAVRSAIIMAQSIVERFQPKSVIDVGCGTGALLEIFRQLGCQVNGLEYSEAGIAYCEKRGLAVRKFNIVNDRISEPESYDVAVSFEVAEHLPVWSANKYIRLLCELAPHVVMSAATPGSGDGHGHINEQHHSYWIKKFAENGYLFDRQLSDRLSSEWRQAGAAYWYCDNVMCFHCGQLQSGDRERPSLQ